jgi:hypothetical protein
MTINTISTCPDCGGDIKYYDKVKRIIRVKGGGKRWVKVKRFRCIDCHKLHRLLPEFIFPYKQYDGYIIRGVINGLITSETLGFEDYPCEATMIRWTLE